MNVESYCSIVSGRLLQKCSKGLQTAVVVVVIALPYVQFLLRDVLVTVALPFTDCYRTVPSWSSWTSVSVSRSTTPTSTTGRCSSLMLPLKGDCGTKYALSSSKVHSIYFYSIFYSIYEIMAVCMSFQI